MHSYCDGLLIFCNENFNHKIMLNSIIEFSIKNKLVVAIFVFALIGYGGYQYTKLPIDAVPDITNNQVQVITVAPALGATDIERLVTFPVELANSNISGLKEIRSFSRFGLVVGYHCV
jgi:cobalt-zinc-cadmium resistance protein CzcA